MQGGQSGGNFLRNPKAQIGIIAGAGALLVGFAVWFFLFNRPSAPTTQDTNVSPGLQPSAAAGNAPAGAAGVPPGLSGVAPQQAQAAAPTPAPARSSGPPPPHRSDPFAPTAEIKEVLASIPQITGPSLYPPRQFVYLELNPEREEDEDAAPVEPGPPIPTMRVAGVLRGNGVSVLMQIGTAHVGPFRPGQMIEQTYRVERIEADQVVLSREYRDRRGRPQTQIIDVSLTGVPRAATGAATP